MHDLINRPNPARLVLGLRETGYDFNMAAADIVDNSIAADADRVCVKVEMNADGDQFVYFGDNGHGMDENDVWNALQYGAPVREDLASLGKFGLGLKTASTAICRRLTVISRKSPDSPLVKLAWDLDHIAETGNWEMLREDLEPHERDAWEELCASGTQTGTLVVWSNCDRLLSKKFAAPGGANAQNAIKRLRKSLRGHLGTIYHRFLDPGDDRCRNAAITVNGEEVQPWNPFAVHGADQLISEADQKIGIESEDGEVAGAANIRAWILPHASGLDPDQKKLADITYKNQGFYIYREGRLINHGGWLGMFRTHGHRVLLRIEFDIGHELDEVFYVDVKKSGIRFDTEIEEALKEMLNPIVREAQNRQKSGQQKSAAAVALNHRPANISIEAEKSTIKPVIEKVNPEDQTVVITNRRGTGIRIRNPIQNNVNPQNIHVDAVDTITSGDLWVPAIRSPGNEGHVLGVEINKNHDFYQKVYLHAAANGYPVHGMDFLLWAFAVAEFNNTDEEMEPIFEDIREVVSLNLRKLLRNFQVPDPDDLTEDSET